MRRASGLILWTLALGTISAHAELPLIGRIKQHRLKKAHEVEWKNMNLLRDIPLDIGSYKLPEKFGSAGELFLEFRRVPDNAWIVKLEALRRGYASLNDTERDIFAELMKAQYQTSPEDAGHIMFHAYTQLLFKDNKISLRLMKIAEERLQSPVTAFAYALTLANADIRSGGRSDEFNQRKMHAAWSLIDAANRNNARSDERVTNSVERIAHQLMESSTVYKKSLAQWSLPSDREPASSKN